MLRVLGVRGRVDGSTVGRGGWTPQEDRSAPKEGGSAGVPAQDCIYITLSRFAIAARRPGNRRVAEENKRACRHLRRRR